MLTSVVISAFSSLVFLYPSIIIIIYISPIYHHHLSIIYLSSSSSSIFIIIFICHLSIIFIYLSTSLSSIYHQCIYLPIALSISIIIIYLSQLACLRTCESCSIFKHNVNFITRLCLWCEWERDMSAGARGGQKVRSPWLEL